MQEPYFQKRKLIGLERYYLWRPAINNLLAARVMGHFTDDQQKLALSNLIKKHPLLAGIITIDKDYCIWIGPDPQASLPVQTYQGESADDWVHVILQESKRAFHMTMEPMIRFVFIRNPGSFDIIINAHHMICDGLALTYLIKDLIYFINHPEEEPVPTSLPYPLGKNDLPSSVSLNILHKMMIRTFNTIWKRKGLFFDQMDHMALHQNYWREKRKRNILVWKLPESETKALINRCRAEKVTVNSALVTTFYLAQLRLQGDSPSHLRNITIPVNTRSRINDPLGEVIGTFISAFKLKPKINENDAFWDIVRAIHNQIQPRLTDDKILSLPLQMMILDPRLLDSMSFIKYGMTNDKTGEFFLRSTGEHKLVSGYDISNLGRFNYQQDGGKIQLEWIYGPFLFEDLYEKFLGIITVNGRMMFSLSFDEARIDPGTVKGNRDLAMEYLEKAVSW